MERNMETEFIIIKLVESTKENGLKIKNKDTESWNMQTKISMKGIGSKAKDQVKELINTQTVIPTQVNGSVIQKMVMECWKWLQVIDMRATGLMERRMALVFLSFIQGNIVLPMEIFTREISKTEIDRAKESIHGLIAATIKESGSTIR